jgi:DNA polymerase III delta prime subunit
MNLDIHSDILARLNMFIHTCTIPNIIFHGSSGSGKRTLLNKFINLMYNDNKDTIKDYVMYVNCAQGKGIKFIREDLKHFAKTHINTHGGNFLKSIILLNADKLTIDAQSALRRCIEVFSHTTRFFIVVEDKYQLLKPILSRFCEIYVPEPIIDGQLTNMYKYNIEISDGYAARNKSRITAIKRIINKLHNNATLENVRDCVTSLYNKGYHTMDIITYFENKNPFDIDNNKKYNILFHFNQTRREYRSESLAMMFILNSFLLCSNDDLENILLM